MSDITLAIEISNPSSGPRGQIEHPAGSGRMVAAGPGVALGRMRGLAPEIIDAEPLGEGMRHDDDLMPAIDRLCRRCGVGPPDLARVAVSVGPGGYTSLRIAVATAKMLAEATGAEVVPVSSASVAAWSIEGAGAALVCLASKGEKAWCALLPPEKDDPWWEGVAAALPTVLPPAELESLRQTVAGGRCGIAASMAVGVVGAEAVLALRPRTVIGDRFLPASMREAASAVGAHVVEPVFAAAFVLQISAEAAPVDPLVLMPQYAREPEAVTQWRRRGNASG